jgi:Zn-dependent protease/CBS domain-containing protein
MMHAKQHLTIGRIWGIPIGLDWSWFLVFGLVSWSLATGFVPREYPQLGPAASWLIAIAIGLLVFGSVLVHELAHAWVALRNQIPVRSITLHIFGGIATIEHGARTPGQEFRIAIAGPISSLVLAGGFLGLYLLDRGIDVLAAPSIWLARINLMLAFFNLIPAFPLDGGRVLRAAIWRFTGSQARSTRVATFTGQLAAFGFIAFGIYLALTGGLVNGLWLVFIGWFLQNAATAHGAQAAVEEALQGLTAGHLMRRDVPAVSALVPLDRFVADHLLAGGQRFSVVTGRDRPLPDGLVSITNVRRMPEAQWSAVTVGEIMVPWDRVVRVEPQVDLLAALRLMETAGVTQVPVTVAGEQGEQLIGTLSRDDVRRYLATRQELRHAA